MVKVSDRGNPADCKPCHLPHSRGICPRQCPACNSGGLRRVDLIAPSGDKQNQPLWSLKDDRFCDLIQSTPRGIGSLRRGPGFRGHFKRGDIKARFGERADDAFERFGHGHR